MKPPDRRWLRLVVLGAAVAAGLVSWQPQPVALAVGAVLALTVVLLWVRLLSRRDVRALLALWVVVAVNPTASLLLPAPLVVWVELLDDIGLAAAAAVLVVTGVRRRRLRLPERMVTAGLGVFAAAGASSALLAAVPGPTAALGGWLALKLWVCLFVAAQFGWDRAAVRLARGVVVAIVVLVLVVAALQVLYPDVVSDFFGTVRRSRVGVTSVTSVFRQPSQYSTFMLLAVCLILSATPLRGGRAVFGAVAAFFALLSLRLKALVDVLIVVGTRMATAPSRIVLAWAPTVLLVGGSAGVALGAELVEDRLAVLFGTETTSPRQLLYRTAWAIAASGFPLGAGFGRFGSEASRSDYSPVYEAYGLDEVYGFRPWAPIFATDASWATVLGESGWLGTAGVVVALGALAIRLWRDSRTGATVGGESPGRAALMFFVVFVADSVTSPQFFSGFACLSLAVLVSMSASVTRPPAEPHGTPDSPAPHGGAPFRGASRAPA